jgi:uncharacterized protein (TIGR02466 family)
MTNMNELPQFKKLVDMLYACQKTIYEQENLDSEPVLGNMWANINPPGSMNRAHQHPNSLWSGVYYIKAPKNSGYLKIDDPRASAAMLRPRQKKGPAPTRLWREHHYEPIAGRCIMFPSWLMHCVDPNESNDIRISVSFNFLQKVYVCMIKLIYKKLPINKISYLNRKKDGFSADGVEKNFYNSLKSSISKHGIKDPVYIEYGGESYGDILKIIVGNNRVAIAHELGIKEIPCIIKNFKADTYNIEGTVLNTDEEIKKYFYLPDQLQIRRDKDNNIDQIMPVYYLTVMDKYV